MIRWVLAAGLLAAVIVPSATAADLDDGGIPPPPWRGGAYGNSPLPPPPAYHDDDDDDDDYGRGPPSRYSDVPPPRYAGPVPGACVRSEEVRDRLTSHGWLNFHDGRPVSSTVVLMRARRPNGRLYELRLDRCNGDILALRPLELRPYRAYAYRQPRGTWGWSPEPGTRGYRNSDAYRGPYAGNGQRADRDDDWQDGRPYAYSAPRRLHDDD